MSLDTRENMAMVVTMLKAIELPARVADLTACLANVDRDTPDNFQLGNEMSVKESWMTYSRMVLRVKWFKKPPSQSSKGLFQRPKTTELGDREVAVRWVGRGPPACCRHHHPLTLSPTLTLRKYRRSVR